MMEELRRALDPLRNKIRMMAGRAVLSLLKNAVEIQVTLLDGEPKEAELFQQYGFRSKPLPGAEGVQLSANGNRDHTLIFCMDDRRYQLDLCQETGEVSMYSDEGDYFIFKRGRIAEMSTDQLIINAETSVQINTGTIEINAATSAAVNTGSMAIVAPTGTTFTTPTLGATGNIVDNSGAPGATSMQDMRDAHNDHQHPNPEGGNVGLPTVLM